jgi:hypothetical protein
LAHGVGSQRLAEGEERASEDIVGKRKKYNLDHTVKVEISEAWGGGAFK